MGAKLRNVTLSVLLAGLAAVVWAPPAQANRGTPPPGYVPPPQYGQNPHPELPEEPDPYAGNPSVQPTVVPVDLPAVTDPGAGLAGGGDRLDSVPGEAPTTVLDRSESRPQPQPANGGGVIGGILSRTGAETLPLARAGLAALALGVGLIVLARRRRADALT